jgi:hypothetical protein
MSKVRRATAMRMDIDIRRLVVPHSTADPDK